MWFAHAKAAPPDTPEEQNQKKGIKGGNQHQRGK